ncbi:TetR/AcrR family transcriptional regulator [Streptomyces sp. NPDC087850]|uniref:TetR/AcrR family transcriptional regulator n=1 Tax=Streptomyces sp. NPDC087850 TaxID=3365809 RepID=UPI003818F518
MAAQETQPKRGRPRLTERRREQNRAEIAAEAARLFVERGVAGTSVEDIAEAAGASRRTFWHYFSTKEEAVAPLLVHALGRAAEAFEARPEGEPLLEALGRAMIGSARAGGDASNVVDIVRLAREEPGLRRVWLQATSDLEMRMVDAIAHRLGVDSHGLAIRVQAAMITSAIRIMTEEYAWHGDEYGENAGSILPETLRLVGEGFSPGSREA